MMSFRIGETSVHQSGRRRNRGVTLVELMVAMTLGLAIVAAVGYVYVSGTQGYKTQDAQSRMQEDARFVIDTVSRDIRMAGYFGCNRPVNLDPEISVEVIGTQPIMTSNMTWLMASGDDTKAKDRFIDLQYVIHGFGATGAVTHASLPAYVQSSTSGAGRLSGTDVLMVLRSGDDAQHVIENTTDENGRNESKFSVASKLESQGTNPVTVVSDCITSKIYKPSFTGSGPYVVNAENGLNSNTNTSGQYNSLFRHFTSDATLTNFEPVLYFVAQSTSSNPAPTLRRVGISTSATNHGAWVDNGGQTVATGVEALSFSFIYPTSTAAGTPTASMVASDWARVTAVNVQFTMVAADGATRTRQSTQTVGGTSVTDTKLRQAYNFTVGVRGRQFSWGP